MAYAACAVILLSDVEDSFSRKNIKAEKKFMPLSGHICIGRAKSLCSFVRKLFNLSTSKKC